MKIAPVAKGLQAIANNAPEPDELDPGPDQFARFAQRCLFRRYFVIEVKGLSDRPTLILITRGGPSRRRP